MKTYSAKPSDIVRKWYLIDASEAPLGRISTVVADLLTGKGKPMYTPHMDAGDYVVIINAEKLVVTGKKMDDKVYYRHTHYPGGLKQSNLRDLLAKSPEKAVFKAVRGMLPVNKLRDGRLNRLKIYAGGDHEHQAQNPEQVKLKGGK